MSKEEEERRESRKGRRYWHRKVLLPATDAFAIDMRVSTGTSTDLALPVDTRHSQRVYALDPETVDSDNLGGEAGRRVDAMPASAAGLELLLGVDALISVIGVGRHKAPLLLGGTHGIGDKVLFLDETGGCLSATLEA